MTKDEPVARRSGARDPPRPPPAAMVDREPKESRKGTLVTTGVLLIIFTTAFLLAPLLDATPFWQQHFPEHTSRTGLLLWAPLLVASALTRTWRPSTWETELLSRGIRNLGHATLLWWILDPLFAAPRLAALAVFPLLLATPLLAIHAVRTSLPMPGVARKALLSMALAATVTSLLIPVLVWTDINHWLLGILTLPLVATHLVLPPYGAHRARARLEPDPEGPGNTVQTPTQANPMDLPVGTLRPPTSPLRFVITIGGLLIVLLLVAPGLPLSATIAWAALVLALPLILHAVVTRGGTADPRLLIGPPTMQRHESRVHTISDENLEEIDEAVERFLRWGTGRKDLAQKISTLLVQADEGATSQWLENRLALLPSRPWARRARENGLVALLRPRPEGQE